MSLQQPITLIQRLANRAKREIIAQVPPVRWATTSLHERRRREWADMLPPLSERGVQLVERLEADAIVTGLLTDFELPGAADLMAALEPVLEPLSRQDPHGVSTLRPAQEELVQDLALWHWGLSDVVLDIVENYLGVGSRYFGPEVRREVADSRATGVRQWHRDSEDRRMVKLLIWLNDVDASGGPFAYLPVARSEEAVRSLRYVSGFVSDERLHNVVPDDEVRTVTGPKWTAFLADNTRLMHKATPPVTQDRYSVTFTWSTRTPLKTIEPVPWTSAQADRIRSGLSERQLACLPPHLAPRR